MSDLVFAVSDGLGTTTLLSTSAIAIVEPIPNTSAIANPNFFIVFLHWIVLVSMKSIAKLMPKLKSKGIRRF